MITVSLNYSQVSVLLHSFARDMIQWRDPVIRRGSAKEAREFIAAAPADERTWLVNTLRSGVRMYRDRQRELARVSV